MVLSEADLLRGTPFAEKDMPSNALPNFRLALDLCITQDPSSKLLFEPLARAMESGSLPILVENRSADQAVHLPPIEFRFVLQPALITASGAAEGPEEATPTLVLRNFEGRSNLINFSYAQDEVPAVATLQEQYSNMELGQIIMPLIMAASYLHTIAMLPKITPELLFQKTTGRESREPNFLDSLHDLLSYWNKTLQLGLSQEEIETAMPVEFRGKGDIGFVDYATAIAHAVTQEDPDLNNPYFTDTALITNMQEFSRAHRARRADVNTQNLGKLLPTILGHFIFLRGFYAGEISADHSSQSGSELLIQRAKRHK